MLLTALLIPLIAAGVVWGMRRHIPTSPARGWILALIPGLSFSLLLWQTGQGTTPPVIQAMPWLPSLNLELSLYFDSLAALFALLVTGIGTLILVYGGYYFAGDREANRFIAYLFIFMAMMLGLVMAGDILTLFIFWEGTSITSFLLVAYKYQYEEARRGAFRSLFITAGGGIALLAGLLIVAFIAGGTDYATILSSGDVLVESQLYLVALGLVAFGAFTKSAQFPAHIWLPGAMNAPTPASAYLHSATMVKAGIYLMARLNPALGNTEAWFWLLSVVGLLSMLVGAYLGVKQDDLKALLAYSTISQLGILMMLIGQDTEIAFKALIIGVVAHAFYKSSLFMGAGIIESQTGSRSLRALGGLRRFMPLTALVVTIAALSLAGLPPLFGFLAKETLLATAVHPSLPEAVSLLFAAVVVVAAAFKLVQAGLLTVDLFAGPIGPASENGRQAPSGMVIAPAVPALISLALGLLPEPRFVAEFFGSAAANSFGGPVKVSFALWTGLTIPLALSAVAIALGLLLFWRRRQLIDRLRQASGYSFSDLYFGVIGAIDWLGWLATRLQSGQLRFYLSIIVSSMLGLIVLFGGIALPTGQVTTPGFDLRTEFNLLRIMALIAILGGALATIYAKRDFYAILALSATGLSVAVYMAIEPAPDIALVQIVVDILATVVLVLALSRLRGKERPRPEPDSQVYNTFATLMAAGAGILVTFISVTALISRPRFSAVAPFYEGNAQRLTGASDIVGAIIVDFRALDTLIEIGVFGLAGIGVYSLLRYAARLGHDEEAAGGSGRPRTESAQTAYGIAGLPTSSYIQAMANILLPVALVIAATHMLYGHDRPGDGFTAGVIVSLAVGFKYVVFGFRVTRQRLTWLRPHLFIAAGILLAIGSGLAAWMLAGSFLAPVDYGGLIGLRLPAGVKLSSGFVFEVAIALTVLGSVTYILDTLGRPLLDSESLTDLQASTTLVEKAAGMAERPAPVSPAGTILHRSE